MLFFSRLLFALTRRTLGRISPAPGDPSRICVLHQGNVVELNRRCPHQGAPLERGRIEGDWLVCPWHGCRFSLTKDRAIKPSAPTVGRHEARA